MCVCIALCTIVAHNIAQNRPDSFPPYPPDDHHCSVDVYLREGGIHRQLLPLSLLLTLSLVRRVLSSMLRLYARVIVFVLVLLFGDPRSVSPA